MTATDLLLALRLPDYPRVAPQRRGPALRWRHRTLPSRATWRQVELAWRRPAYQPPFGWRLRLATRYGMMVSQQQEW